jgi:hypothetical protein
MTTKTTYAMVAVAAVAAMSFGFSPAFAAETSPFSTSLTANVREYDVDTVFNYENDVCINGNIQMFKQTVTNWGSNDSAKIWYDTGVRGSDCGAFVSMDIKIFVNGVQQYSTTSTDETDYIVVNSITIPDTFNVNNTVKTTFLEYF